MVFLKASVVTVSVHTAAAASLFVLIICPGHESLDIRPFEKCFLFEACKVDD